MQVSLGKYRSGIFSLERNKLETTIGSRRKTFREKKRCWRNGLRHDKKS